MTKRLILTGGLFVTALLTACTPRATDASETSHRPSAVEIRGFIQSKATERAVAYPDVRITDFRITADHTIACGRLVSAGQPPMIFMSPDEDPSTLERPTGLPSLRDPDAWHHPANLRTAERARQVCERNFLLPEQFEQAVREGRVQQVEPPSQSTTP